MSSKQIRLTARWLHILIGVLLFIHLYTPLGNDMTYTLLLQIVFFPLLVMSGGVMWRQAQIVKFIRNLRATP